MTEPQAPRVALLVRAVLAACAALEAAQDELCRLDAVAGDGDEGFAMARAARGLRAELDTHSTLEVTQVLELAAGQLASVGGSMGALCYVLLDALAKARLGAAEPLTGSSIAGMLAIAEDAVCSFGGAHRGDKTIVDAIAGARDAAEQIDTTTALTSLIRCAAAADKAAAATAGMTAKIGRASRLGDRSRGTVDPGARTFALVLSALVTTYAAQAAERPPGTQPNDEAASPAPGGTRS
jgi:dihydroxyacetone kinase